MPRIRRRFWVETVMAAACAALTLITLLQKDWIEVVFGVEPDAGSGALEWLIVAGLVVLTGAFGLLAGTEWRRAAAGG